MVYLHLPQSLTEEEEMLQRKYAKLRKKKMALAARRAPKQEAKEPVNESLKRAAEDAAGATEQAKKLLKSGVIKVEVDKKDHTSFKRSKRQKDQERGSVSFQPFSPVHGDAEDERPELSGRPRMKSLGESFISSKQRDRERESRKEMEAPKRGNTIYVKGHGLTEDLLRKAFSDLGAVVNISMEKEKSCGFVTFENMDTSDKAINELDGGMVLGVQLRVSIARRQPSFETAPDDSSTSWGSIAASLSQKGNHKDTREPVAYEDSPF